mgnify:CR=1 FL=1
MGLGLGIVSTDLQLETSHCACESGPTTSGTVLAQQLSQEVQNLCQRQLVIYKGIVDRVRINEGDIQHKLAGLVSDLSPKYARVYKVHISLCSFLRHCDKEACYSSGVSRLIVAAATNGSSSRSS